MNMYNIKVLLTVLFVSLLALSQLSLAQQEYDHDENLWIDAGFLNSNDAVHSPKVACNPSNTDDCVVVYYYSGYGFIGSHLALRWTFDGFETIGAAQVFPVTVDYETTGLTFGVRQNYTEMSLPFDVVYFNDKYYTVFDVGQGLGNFANYVYTWTPTEGFNQTLSAGTATSWFTILYKDTAEPVIAYLVHDDLVSGVVKKGYRYLINGTLITETVIFISADCGTSLVNNDYIDVRGFWENGTTEIYDLDMRIKCGAGAWHSDASGNFPLKKLGNFVHPYTALWYWDGTRLFYKLSNMTLGTGTVLYSTTSDLTNFGTPEVYHIFNQSYDEFINFTDSDINSFLIGGVKPFAFKASTNLSGVAWSLRKGMFVAQQSMMQLRIAYPSAIDLDDLSIDYVNVTAILDCNDFAYQTSGSGNFIDLYTPCENNTLTLIPESGVYPQTQAIEIELEPQCQPNTVSIDQQYRKPYDFIVRVADALTGERVSGVAVNVDGIANTTDANGEAVIADFFPVTATNFASFEIGCSDTLDFDGTPKAVSVIGSKSGYTTYTATEYFANEPLGDPLTDFDRDYSFKMTPPSTQLNVRAFTQDAVELEVDTADINVYGANTTYLFEDGSYYPQSYSDTLPSLFVLVDSRNNYSVNATLEYCNESHQQNITVTEGAYQEAVFDLDAVSTSLCCETNLDCPTSFCEGKYWKRSDGCNLQQCQYSTIVCDSATLCDDDRGCFDYQGSQTCTDDLDCLNQSTCLTDFRSRTGLCGSDNLCIFKNMVCVGECNSTVGLCEEAEWCLELGSIRHRFLIQTTTQPFIDGVYTTYQDADYYCGLNNRGERRCIDGAIVPISVDLVGVTTLPDAWVYTSNASHYTFHDIAIVCDNLCNITYDYCEYGCNAETAYCHIAPLSPEGQVSVYTDMVVNWWYLIFPTSAAQSIAYIFIALAVSAAITYYTGKNGSGNNGLTFLGATIAIVLGGVPLGTIPFFVGVIYAVIAGYLLLKMWRG